MSKDMTRDIAERTPYERDCIKEGFELLEQLRIKRQNELNIRNSMNEGVGFER